MYKFDDELLRQTTKTDSAITNELKTQMQTNVYGTLRLERHKMNAYK